MTEQLLAPLHPNETALMPLFQQNIDRGMLREIANADYGCKAEECFPLLQTILKTGVAASDDWNLSEVLNLTRWDGGPGPRGDWKQLFACTALVQLAPRYREFFDPECETLARLVANSINLGEPVARAAVAVLAWRFLTYPGAEEVPPFLAFAILLLAAHLERREDRGPWLKQLAEWVEDEESGARRRLRRGLSSAVAPSSADVGVTPSGGPNHSIVVSPDEWKREWLFGLTYNSQHEPLWRSLSQSILLSPKSPHPREADETLRRLGRLAIRS
jgi:hypothetical protein